MVEQYLSYLIAIKGRSENTFKEYRTDLLMFFSFVILFKGTPMMDKNFLWVNFYQNFIS
jgi:site-specific recombinase XerD